MVRDAAPGVNIPTDRIIELANREGRLGTLTSETLDRILDSGMDSLFSSSRISTAANRGLGVGGDVLVREVPLDQAMTIKSQLLEFSRENARSIDPAMRRSSKIAGFLGHRMDDAIGKTLDGVPPQRVVVETASGTRTINVKASDLLEKANRFTAITKDAFENRAIASLTRRILKDEPAQLAKAVLRPDRPAALVKLERAVGKSHFDSIVRPQLFRGVIERFKIANPTRPEFGLMDGSALLNHLKTLGDEVVEKAFGPRAGELVDLATAIEVAGTRATGPGKIFIQLAQAGAFIGMATFPFGGAVKASAPAIIIGPNLLGRLFFNPTAIRGLINGLNAGTGTVQFARAITLLSGLAAESATDRESNPDRLVESVGVTDATIPLSAP